MLRSDTREATLAELALYLAQHMERCPCQDPGLKQWNDKQLDNCILCDGSGKMPRYPQFRRKCPSLAWTHRDDTFKCENCIDGSGWVLDVTLTKLLDALMPLQVSLICDVPRGRKGIRLYGAQADYWGYTWEEAAMRALVWVSNKDDT